ncbi:HAD-IIIC family phosphatase [Acetobacter sp. TBRC 12305]|uniref:HAD family hydrolase n=1 Tax=Acetobacter garciniae TaxID=2817435 RepID=A0A939HJC9_9PROT|nr:HAD-IIIC family phosphatase [Acetobacter garciniae]MBO1325505.1 HAD family hydrolase [Acetobacter garciniae]MBX0345323.1 HAD-IIIC family phosphatase [Acetobacter garciniae]
MEQLFWLPPHADLSGAIRAARVGTDPQIRLQAARNLSAFRRDFVQTGMLDRLIPQAVEAPEGLRACRLAILASHTVEHLLPAIRVACLARGLLAEIWCAPYGQYRQALLAPDGDLARFAPDFILLALDRWDTPLDVGLGATSEMAEAATARRVEELRGLWRRGRALGATVIQQSLIRPDTRLFGSYDRQVPGSPTAIAARLDSALCDTAKAEGVPVLDMEVCAALTGGAQALGDPARWHQAKQLVTPAAAPTYGDVLARIMAAACGLSRKCLVLDLDNTVWGGVVGDDGPEGLRLGQGSPEGESYTAFQHYIAQLGQRGIVLAVCSKNDTDMAERGFAHADMVLKRGDIAAFVANWDDKATNIRMIAQTLGLGLDALVFVDDNPAERAIVRRELPMVAVPEMPDDCALYPQVLAASGCFEAVSFTPDDLQRNRSYAANNARAAAMQGATDLDGYLRELDMRLLASRIDDASLARAVQLLNKTNQFNLTTRRYGEAEFRLVLATPGVQGWAFRLIDRFGDNGLVSVVLTRAEADEQRNLIENWVMSCRVLGRGVENAIFAVLALDACERGVGAMRGEYRPTPRNAMVSTLYGRLGFDGPDPAGTDGAVSWRYDMRRGVPPSPFIKVEMT